MNITLFGGHYKLSQLQCHNVTRTKPPFSVWKVLEFLNPLENALMWQCAFCLDFWDIPPWQVLPNYTMWIEGQQWVGTFPFTPYNKETKMVLWEDVGPLSLLHHTTKKQRRYHEKRWCFGQEVALVYGGLHYLPLLKMPKLVKVIWADNVNTYTLCLHMPMWFQELK
jgi:hypothetical protein